jgi:D-3-phosphoglycerate dehydrogenase
MKVLVCERLAASGIKIFEDTPGIEVDVSPGLTYEELASLIADYDGAVIGGATRITERIIDAAFRLKVIGRAGAGLENVDLKAASRRGIVVMNTPEGHAVATAEHAIALILALSRNIAQANQSLREGRWEQERFAGQEVFNKVLGLVGAGHVGRIVADRAKGLRMKVIAYDPHIKPDVIEKIDLEPVSFEDLLARSDYISVHTPRTAETVNLFNKDTIALMKKGAMLVNCAHAGIVSEEDLFDALDGGRLRGAALDVFTREPPGEHRLMTLSNFICTPHLSASTKEAEEAAARELAQQMTAYLLHGTVKNAVNVPSISSELMNILGPYVILMERIGLLQAQLAEGAILEVSAKFSGAITEHDTSPLTTAVLKGLLTPVLGDHVNFVNAPILARDRGIKITESRTATCDDFSSLASVTVRNLEGENLVSGTIFGARMPRIIQINDFYLEAVPEGHLILIRSEDRPGVIGLMGTTLGRHGININRMQVGQQADGGRNIILLTTGLKAPAEAVDELLRFSQVESVKMIEL